MGRLDSLEQVTLTRQLATLVRAGIPIDRCLACLCQQARNPHLKAAWQSVYDLVLQGRSLSRACAGFPTIFSPFYLALLRTGESTGQLDSALEKLSQTLERNLLLRKRLKAALTYPVFVLALTLGLSLFLFTSVVPGFLEILRGSGRPLPWPTQVLSWLAHWVTNPTSWLIFGGLTLEGFLLTRNALADPKRRIKLWEFALRLPLLGRLLSLAATCIFCSSMHTLLVCGTNLDRALVTASEAADNPVFSRVVALASRQILAGRTLTESLNPHRLFFPWMMIQLISTGEETSQLDQMFAKIAANLEQDLDERIEAIGVALEPLLLTSVAAVVAFVIFAVFLPIYGTLDSA